MSVSVTYGRKPRRRVLPWVISAVTVALLAAVGGLLWASGAVEEPTPFARVRVQTEPPGAAVTLDGRTAVGVKTPLTLPEVSRGRHQLLVTLPGYVPLRTTIDVPSAGEVELPLLRLAPEPPVPPPAASRDVVTITVRSQPLGALIRVGEREIGRTPHALQALPGEALTFRVELAGFEPVTRTVTVETSDREEQVVLERVTETAQRKRGGR